MERGKQYYLLKGYYYDSEVILRKKDESRDNRMPVLLSIGDINVCPGDTVRGIIKEYPKKLEITSEVKDMILEICLENMSPKIMALHECLNKPPFGLKIYMITNEAGKYGSGAILLPEVQEHLKELMPGGYYIIPSSVHELLAVEKEGVDENAMNLKLLLDMVNRDDNLISRYDVLSDHIYGLENGKLHVVI